MKKAPDFRCSCLKLFGTFSKTLDRNLLVFAESSALLDRLSVMGLVLYRQLGGSFRIQRQLLTCEVCAV